VVAEVGWNLPWLQAHCSLKQSQFQRLQTEQAPQKQASVAALKLSSRRWHCTRWSAGHQPRRPAPRRAAARISRRADRRLALKLPCLTCSAQWVLGGVGSHPSRDF